MHLRSRTPAAFLAHLLFISLALGANACGGSSSPTAPDQSSVPYSQTDLRVGTGTEAAAGKRVAVNYTGWLYSASAADNKGTQFDSSAGRGAFEFVLGAGSVIPGWDRGVVGMKAGGERRLVIPPALAYGSSGNGPIPPNAALVFDVQLVAVQ
jgi:FKBP-type peptidyl-prolyl cis-trans isomerase FkpA